MTVLTADLFTASDAYLREQMDQIAAILAAREVNKFVSSVKSEFVTLNKTQIAKAREFARLNGYKVGQRGRLSIGLQMQYARLHDASAVRQWAAQRGMKVAKRGRIAKNVWSAWFDFNGMIALPAKSASVKGARKQINSLAPAARAYGKRVGLIAEGTYNGRISKKVWEAFAASMV